MPIRPAQSTDVPAIVHLWREMWEFHRRFDPRFEATPLADSVMKNWVEGHLTRERSRVLVAEEKESVAGYCLSMILENPPVVSRQFFGYISEIAVTERARRSGTGGRLLEEMHRWFQSNGCAYVEANISVFNDVARRFWRKYGYQDFLERLRLEL